jgi:hypothetical protein
MGRSAHRGWCDPTHPTNYHFCNIFYILSLRLLLYSPLIIKETVMAEVVEERPAEKEVVHEHYHDGDRRNNTGLIVAIIVIVLLLLLIFGRGLIGGGSSGGSSAPSVSPSTSGGQ